MKIEVVFDGPPNAKPGRFVETERPDGSGVGVGNWRPYRELHPAHEEAIEPWWTLELDVVDHEAHELRIEAEGGNHLDRLDNAYRKGVADTLRWLMGDGEKPVL